MLYKIVNNYSNFIIIYIFDCFYNVNNIQYRQEFELKYAIDNFAIYWKPTIGFQRKLTNMYLKILKEVL